MWKGVIIEESLEDKNILGDVEIAHTNTTTLEEEDNRGNFHFHKVQVSDDKIEKVIEIAKSSLKKGWYMHFCKGNEMIVMFKGKIFKHKKGNKASLTKILEYGLSLGINKSQLPDDRLIGDPWA